MSIQIYFPLRYCILLLVRSIPFTSFLWHIYIAKLHQQYNPHSSPLHLRFIHDVFKSFLDVSLDFSNILSHQAGTNKLIHLRFIIQQINLLHQKQDIYSRQQTLKTYHQAPSNNHFSQLASNIFIQKKVLNLNTKDIQSGVLFSPPKIYSITFLTREVSLSCSKSCCLDSISFFMSTSREEWVIR